MYSGGIFISYLRTEDGTRMTVKESVGFVTGVSSAPVFGYWDFKFIKNLRAYYPAQNGR